MTANESFAFFYPFFADLVVVVSMKRKIDYTWNLSDFWTFYLNFCDSFLLSGHFSLNLQYTQLLSLWVRTYKGKEHEWLLRELGNE
jgi:hypothetical protein